jgi:membrane fusion protein, multidrug efflux system
MTRRMALMLVALTAVFGYVLGSGFLDRQLSAQRIASYRPPPVAVAAAIATEQSWERYLRATGTLVAVREIQVSCEVDGQVTAVHFESGARVKPGDLLIELDDQVEQADLKSFRAKLQLAQLNFDRDRQMYAKDLLSRTLFDRSRAELDEASALLEQTQAMIAKKQVRAPFEGRLGIRQVSPGQYLAAGDTAVSLQSLDPLFIDFSFPEQYLPDVRVGQRVAFLIKAYPGREFEAEVTAIDARVNPNTRNISVRALAQNVDELLLPGMFADVRLSLGAGQPLVVVPETAILYSLYGQGIFTVVAAENEGKGDNLVVRRRRISTGISRDGMVEVLDGLEPGATVVISGTHKLRDGTPVSIANPGDLAGTRGPSAVQPGPVSGR